MGMLKTKIVADSCADVLELKEHDFTSVPLKIRTNQKEYVDDENLNVEEMVGDLLSYSGKSGTACPNTQEWLDAFGDADEVYCVTITSNLSGSYNSACTAKEEYERLHPDRRVLVVDTLSAGPEEKLIVEKLQKLISERKTFDEIAKEIKEYLSGTRLLFMLESLKNLANNGRVNPLVAKASGILGIRLVGRASDHGTLEPLDKCRGEKRALATIVQRMKEMGHVGGKVRISHCFNENAALQLKELILKEFKNAKIEIYRCRGLCSFYAEKGGLLLGFETGKA